MKRHLERSLVLENTSEFKNLYSWSLSEVGESTTQAVTNQIPWDGSVYFTLYDIEVISSLSRNRYGAAKDEAPKVVAKSHVQAKLRPGLPNDSTLSSKYSMLGTDRLIEVIGLSIYPKSADDVDDLSVFGGVSFTHDVDFYDQDIPDYLDFMIFLPEETFAQLVSNINLKAIGGGTLRLIGVEGLYSRWTPSASTMNIKVLTDHQTDHPVQIPEGCEILPPRLGKVGGFDMTLWSDRLHPKPTAGQSDEDEGAAARIRLDNPPRNSPLTDPGIIALLKSLRLAAWAIAALLLIVALK